MQIDISEWSIVIAGGWNRRIFTPQWVQENVFRTNQVKMEFSLIPGNAPRYTQLDIVLSPETDRLLLRPLRTDDALLQLLEEKALLVLDTLPHTPVVGVGINFAYLETDPASALLDHFRIADTEALGTADYAIEETAVLRRLRFDEHQLNLGIILTEDHNVALRFNFHTDVSTTHEAGDAIRGRVIELRDRAVHFLDEVYGLTIEEAQG